jgi:cytoskeletal protein CcmA (bactofilin family)
VALIGEGCIFDGDIISPSSTRIDGSVRGKISTNGILVVGEKGIVKGEVKAIEVIVHGKIEGSVESQRLEIKRDSSISGDVFTKSLIIENGGIYNGRCTMEQPSEKIIAQLPSKTETKSIEIKVQSKTEEK